MLDLADQPVHGLYRLSAPAEDLVDPGYLPPPQQLVEGQPQRSTRGKRVEVGWPGGRQPAEVVRVAGCRDVRPVGCERRQLQEERLVAARGDVDELRASLGQHVGQVVPRPMTERLEMPVCVQLI